MIYNKYYQASDLFYMYGIQNGDFGAQKSELGIQNSELF